jgi:hypothetical protein
MLYPGWKVLPRRSRGKAGRNGNSRLMPTVAQPEHGKI